MSLASPRAGLRVSGNLWMFKLTLQGIATHLGESELYDKNPDLAPVYIEHGQDYLVNIFTPTGSEYLEYVEILSLNKQCLAYIRYHREFVPCYWKTHEIR